jgi:transposase
MQTLHPRCAGTDVPKKAAVVCVRRGDPGGPPRQQVRTSGTMTADLLGLAGWPAERGLTHAAVESTGVYWKPVFNLLEGRRQVILVNAEHSKRVPGRKPGPTAYAVGYSLPPLRG